MVSMFEYRTLKEDNSTNKYEFKKKLKTAYGRKRKKASKKVSLCFFVVVVVVIVYFLLVRKLLQPRLGCD